jgi:CBS domain-containing protein
MTTAREIMTPAATYLSDQDTVMDAARIMADQSVGALPVCSPGKHLVGMVTDRDIVVKALANGKDPAKTKLADLVQEQSEVVTIGADDDAEEILHTMSTHKVRRLPVIDGHDLVGMVTQADVARSLPDPQVGDLLDAISQD